MNEIEWEDLYRQKKIDKTLFNIQRSMNAGYTSETSVGQTIINQFLSYISEELEDLSNRKTRGMGGKYAEVFRDAVEVTDSYGKLVKDYNRAAYIGLLTILDCVFHQKKKKNHVGHIVEKIGERLEEEQRFNVFNRTSKDFTYVRWHQLQNSSVKGKKTRLIKDVHKAWADQGKNWEPWGNKVRVQIGMRVLRSVLRVMDDYLILKQISTGSRKEFCVLPTNELIEFMDEHEQHIINKMTSTQPCIEKPIDWERHDDGSITGGFHSINVCRTVPFIRSKTRAQSDHILLHNPNAHTHAVNLLQSTTWSVNTDVLQFIRDCMYLGDYSDVLPSLHNKDLTQRPPDEEEELRKAWGKEAQSIIKWNKSNATRVVQIQNILSLCQILKDREFWFVHNCDFRGRIYSCSSYLNPQGTDYVRGLLQFSQGKPLGEQGIKWLAVHGANCYGFSSVSYTDRYQWVLDNLEGIQQSSREPHSHNGRRLLKESKDPFRFYAFCREWDRLYQSKVPEAFVSHLPVTIDGSCNGFQHISALLRDERGGRRVNLTHEALPQDLYTNVSDELIRRLTRDTDNVLGTLLLKGGIDRNTVKPIVMTIPYGLTIRGASLYIQDYLNNNSVKYGLQINDLKNWDLIRYLAQLIVEITEDFVQSSQKLRAWLRECSDLLAGSDKPVSWISPVGFPVMQPYTLFKQESIKTELFGNKTIYYRDKPQGVLRDKSRISLTPNLIHSLDSSHLVMALNKANKEGIHDLTAIHDCIGTYAADTHRLREITNESFCELYIPDVLEGIKRQWEEITPLSQLPEYGTYDSTEVLSSKYFFG